MGLRQNLWVDRDPPPVQRTTVLASVKASLAALGGFAGPDPGCTPWSRQVWAMGERGAPGNRVSLANEVIHRKSVAHTWNKMLFIN